MYIKRDELLADILSADPPKAIAEIRYEMGVMDATKQICGIIKEASTGLGWLPTSLYKPMTDGYYLCCTISALGTPMFVLWWSKKDYGFYDGDGQEIPHIDYWMSLPEAPEVKR